MKPRMRENADVLVVTGLRTPFGRYGGLLRDVPSIELGAHVIKELVQRSRLDGAAIDEVFYGTCMPAETALQQNIPARQAVLKAGLPPTVLSMTVDRACCSSSTALHLACRSIQANAAGVTLVVGADNMSRVPLLLPGTRFGHRLGGAAFFDPLDQLGYAEWNPVARDAGEVALARGVGREEQDAWAVLSQTRYAAALSAGRIADELAPFPLTRKGGPERLDADEFPKPQTTFEALRRLRTVYGSPTVTPGNAPGLDAGACAALVTSRTRARDLGLHPLARVVATASVAVEPRLIAEAPAPAILKALAMARLSIDDVELIEINEAFAAMPLVSTLLLAKGDRLVAEKLQAKTNVNGGAIAVGHPVGASGIRLVLTLALEMRRRGARYGVAAICGGLGQADATVLELESERAA
jgi:acetyl-CoA C-acetyltransferase